ncbi:MAG: AI-2E family transporter [Planctomycetota bacterium]|jgi:AI-2 transport protein TqsA
MAQKSVHYEQRIQTVCLLILTALGIAGAMYAFSSVLIPFVLAVFLTLSLIPAIDIQMKWLRIPRRTAILTTVLFGCAVLVLAAMLVTAAANQIVDNKDHLADKLEALILKVKGLIPSDWHTGDPNDPNIPGGSPADPNESMRPASDPNEPPIRIPTDTVRKVLAGTARSILVVISNTVRKMLAATASSIMGVISNGLLVLIFMIFMVAGKGTYKSPEGSLWWEVEIRIKRYVITILGTSGITGILVGVTLSILGVQFGGVRLGWMFGFLAFMLNFIPNIGSVIATILPLPFALLDPQLGLVSKILVLVIPGTIQFVIGNLLQPKMLGESLDLHPVVVLMSLIFFGTIWGIIGMFLAVPITAVVKIFLQRFGYTRAIADLAAGKTDVLTKTSKSSKTKA